MRHRTLRRRYGHGSAVGFKPAFGTGVVVAHLGPAFVTREPDELFYSWLDNGKGANWYLAFKSKAKALAHMRVLARTV
jgi:hypothetical protein